MGSRLEERGKKVTTPSNAEELWADLRACDPDRYLTARFAPRHARASLMALYAFNAELTRIPGIVSEPALGEFRLQWWRDALSGMPGDVSFGVPLADALEAAIRAHDLPIATLLGMIDARSADLGGGGFADLQALKAYLYKSQGAVFALGAQILGGRAHEHDRAANAAGLAYGLAIVLRTLPRDVAAGRIMVPLALLKECGLEPELLLAGEGGDRVSHLVAELGRESRRALVDAHGQLADCKTPLRAAFAPLALVAPYLDALDAPGHNPVQHIADINPLARFLRLWWSTRSGRI